MIVMLIDIKIVINISTVSSNFDTLSFYSIFNPSKILKDINNKNIVKKKLRTLFLI